MILLKQMFLSLCGASFGLLSSAGVFTVLASVGLIPRFAGKMHVAKKVFALEEAVIFGTIGGGLASVFSDYGQIGAFVIAEQLFFKYIWGFCRHLYRLSCLCHCRDA